MLIEHEEYNPNSLVQSRWNYRLIFITTTNRIQIRAIRKNASTIAIWTVYERGFNYNDFNECHCIWDSTTPKGTYHAPTIQPSRVI